MIYTVTILDFTRAVAIFWASPVNPLTNFTSRAPLRTAALNKFLASGPAFRVSATWSEVLHRHHGGHVHIISNLWLYLRLLKMYNTTIQMSYYVHIYIWILYIYAYLYIYIVHHGLGIAMSWWFFTGVSLLKLYEPVLVEITHGNGIQSSWCFSSRQWLYHGDEWS